MGLAGPAKEGSSESPATVGSEGPSPLCFPELPSAREARQQRTAKEQQPCRWGCELP